MTLRRLKNEQVFTLGILCSALSIVFERFTSLQYLDFSISDFVSGMFTGLSMTLLLFFLFNFRKGSRRTTTEGDAQGNL